MTGSVDDDAELLRRVARGDEAAFDALWERHTGWLLLRLRRRTDTDAVDLVQETFLSVWRNAGSFRSGTDAGAWLWSIASRRLVDSHRRAASRPRTVDLDALESPAPHTPSSEDLALADALDPRLELAVSRLSPELAAALQAVVLDQMSTREASAVLGVPEGTVKSRASRARAFLRERVAHPNRPTQEPT